MASAGKLVSAYFVITCISIAAVCLLAMMIHLISVARKNLAMNPDKPKRMLKIFVGCTVFAISCFELAMLLIIHLIAQILMIDGNEFVELHTGKIDEMLFLIPAFDTCGHCIMVYLFIARFEYAFQGSQFAYSRRLRVGLYLVLVLLILFFFLILLLIALRQSPHTILVLEIIWEVVVEVMCCVVLYLFLAKLYTLLTMSFSKTDLLGDLTKSLSQHYAQKKERSKSGSGSKKNSSKKSSKLPSKQTKSFVPPQKTPPLAPSPSPPVPVRALSRQPTETNLTKPMSVLRPFEDDDEHGDSALDANGDEPEQTHTVTIRRDRSMSARAQDADANDLVNAMNKMTLLVIAAVLSSFLSLIGNVFIELHGMETIDRHQIDIASMWAFILPVFDMVITSLMLYLQFTYTKNVYVVLCGKLDMLLMKTCMKLIHHLWQMEKQKEMELRMHMEDQAPSKMLSIDDTVKNSNSASSAAASAVTAQSEPEIIFDVDEEEKSEIP